MTIHERPVRRRRIALGAAAIAAALALPAGANAAYSSAVVGTTVTFTGDDAADTLVIGASGGFLNVSVNGAPASTDLDTVAAGVQTLPDNDTATVVVNAGGGDDVVTIATPATLSVTVDGGAGNDLVTGNDDADALRGGDGNDRVVGARGNDDLEGGAGNDVLVWNNGDGSDVMDGDAGLDETEVNGAATAGDAFTIAPNGPRVRFDRVNLVPFTLDIAVERLAVNGLGGNDTMTGAPGLAPLIALGLSGGVGADQITGGDGADLISGGEEADVLDGGGGGDRVIGDRGDDVMRGGAGDDTLVWNNGDNNDRMDGDDGRDVTEVNGAGAGDAFAIVPNGARARFDRTNLVPFTLDIAVEALDVRGLGGPDTFAAAAGALPTIGVDGGEGDDVLVGSAGPDTLLGGSGNDTITGAAGLDLLDGQEGDDTLNARDGAADAVRGGAGNDRATTDAPTLDVVDGVEALDALPAADTRATRVAVVTSRATVRLRRGRASVALRISCPAAERGGCRGTMELTSARLVRVGALRGRVVLARASYRLNPGRARLVTVRLPRGIAALGRRGAVAVRVSTVTRDAAGNTAVGSKRLTLRVPRR